MKRLVIACGSLLLISLTGCSTLKYNPFPKYGGKIQGTVWCQSRYLDMVDAYQTPPKQPNSEYGKKLRLAKEGYVYALAATLVLQKDNGDKQYNFKTPDYLQPLPALSENNPNGFQAESYAYRNPTTQQTELIIAFRGSDQFVKDYFFQNLAIVQVQNKPARRYVARAVAYRDAHKDQFGPKVVVTGNSLGGGLAAHVTLHDETRHLVTDAWAFNPSPRTGIWWPPKGGDPRIRLLSTDQEILNVFRRWRVGAPEVNQARGYDLISSSSVYNHYRWVLAREIFWYADLALYFDSGKTARSTPPLEILKGQTITDAHCEDTEKVTAQRRARYEAEVAKGRAKASGVIAEGEVTTLQFE